MLPPPFYFLLFTGLMWLNPWSFSFSVPLFLTFFVSFFSILIAILSLFPFLTIPKAHLNPVTPQKTKILFTHGIYHYSRNPMYLSLLLLAFAWFLFLGNLLNLVLFYFFYFILLKQIRTEENVLITLFGEHFLHYCQKTSRWF